MWVFDDDVGMNCRDVTFVPGLYKIFDEILGMSKLMRNIAFHLISFAFKYHFELC